MKITSISPESVKRQIPVVSVSQQGYNRLDNIVLAHVDCNQLANTKSLIEKILLRDEMNCNLVNFKIKPTNPNS